MSASDTRTTHERLLAARRFIDESYHEPINLEEMARTARLSRFHFLRVFRDTFRETPHQYLQKRRIARAKELLAAGHHSVTDVCFEVGFESLGSFSTLFRRTVGQSPMHYRTGRLIVVPTLPGVPSSVTGPLIWVPACFMQTFGAAPPADIAA
jgi:AraC-like DNA-binding protein